MNDAPKITMKSLDRFNREVAEQLWPKAPKPRRMRQPVKDELRRQLEVAKAEAAFWRGKFEDALPARVVLCVGFLSGLAIGWLL